MAYPTIDKPYGFKPINLIGGQVFAGSTRKMRIASGLAANIGCGDLLIRVDDGTVTRSSATTAKPTGGFAGVFLGCEFINPSTGQLQFQQNFVSGTTVTLVARPPIQINVFHPPSARSSFWLIESIVFFIDSSS